MGTPRDRHEGYAPPGDFAPLRTADGSFTLRSERLQEQYHSRHGAVQESMHVFIEAGLRAVQGREVRVLEVGLGTGLNALLSRIEAERADRALAYVALEPFPLAAEELRSLDHAALLLRPDLAEDHVAMLTAPESTWYGAGPHFRFQRRSTPVQQFEDTGFDLIYFDAFGPATQPDMWTLPVFERMFRALPAGGVLVTYCAKGDVRRTMQAAGLQVERLAGPPGKREMLRAIKE